MCHWRDCAAFKNRTHGQPDAQLEKKGCHNSHDLISHQVFRPSIGSLGNPLLSMPRFNIEPSLPRVSAIARKLNLIRVAGEQLTSIAVIVHRNVDLSGRLRNDDSFLKMKRFVSFLAEVFLKGAVGEARKFLELFGVSSAIMHFRSDDGIGSALQKNVWHVACIA